MAENDKYLALLLACATLFVSDIAAAEEPTPEPDDIEFKSVSYEGQLSTDEGESLVEKNQTELESCFAKAIEEEGTHYAYVRFEAFAMPNGKVGAFRSEASTNEMLEQCIEKSVRAWAFPKAEKGLSKLRLGLAFGENFLNEHPDKATMGQGRTGRKEPARSSASGRDTLEALGDLEAAASDPAWGASDSNPAEAFKKKHLPEDGDAEKTEGPNGRIIKVEAPKGVDRELVAANFHANSDKFVSCYEFVLFQDASQEGKAKFTVELGERGRSVSVKAESEFPRVFDACIRSSMRNLRLRHLSQPKGETITVTFDFKRGM